MKQHIQKSNRQQRKRNKKPKKWRPDPGWHCKFLKMRNFSICLGAMKGFQLQSSVFLCGKTKQSICSLTSLEQAGQPGTRLLWNSGGGGGGWAQRGKRPVKRVGRAGDFRWSFWCVSKRKWQELDEKTLKKCHHSVGDISWGIVALIREHLCNLWSDTEFGSRH